MKKRLLLGILGACTLSSQAQTFKEWQDPEINAVNRAPMHTNFLLTRVQRLLIRLLRKNPTIL